jgi:hypothetical protein
VALSDAERRVELLTLRYPLLATLYDFGPGGWWDFEVDVKMEDSLPRGRFRIVPKVEFPDFKARKLYFPAKYKAPT